MQLESLENRQLLDGNLSKWAMGIGTVAVVQQLINFDFTSSAECLESLPRLNAFVDLVTLLTVAESFAIGAVLTGVFYMNTLGKPLISEERHQAFKQAFSLVNLTIGSAYLLAISYAMTAGSILLQGAWEGFDDSEKCTIKDALSIANHCIKELSIPATVFPGIGGAFVSTVLLVPTLPVAVGILKASQSLSTSLRSPTDTAV